MKKINYLLLIIMLAIPFVGARATYDYGTRTMTYDVSWSGGQIAGSYNGNWNGNETWQWDDAVTVNITCSSGGYLNSADIIVIRKLASEKNLMHLNLTGASFGYDGNNYVTGVKDEWGYYHDGHSVAGQIGEYMFYNCPKLVTVIIPSNISIIGTGAFRDCANLETVNIPSGVTEINWQTFKGDTKLRSLDFAGSKSNITLINSQAFQDCTSLSASFFEGFTGVKTIGYMTFKNTKIGDTGFANIMQSFRNGNVSSGDGGYNKIPYQAFYDCTALTTADLSNVKTYNSSGSEVALGIDESAFKGCTSLANVTLGANLSNIGDSAFANCTSLANVNVKRGVAPSCPVNAFLNVTPNKCTVTFASIDSRTGPFDTNYQNFTTTTGYRTYYDGAGFQYLLTKTMNENTSTYDVEKQYHAIVNLTRTFKVGWNTLCLPFGSPSWGSSDSNYADCAELYKNALHEPTNGDFMIAAYRGLKNNSVFIFINYSNFENDPLDEFEPIMVYLSQADITSHADVYTFTDVNVDIDMTDVDYSGALHEYSASTVHPLANVIGQYDTEPGAVFTQGCTYDKYKFQGTFAPIEGDGTTLLTDKDYYLQGNKFFAYQSGYKYMSKGYRAYFKYIGPTGAKPSSYDIQVFDTDGTEVTGVINMTVDGEQNDTGNIYNLNGQLIRTNSSSTEGLAKGVYIVNGKKVIVK